MRIPCWYFSKLKGLSIMNSSLQVRRSMRNSTPTSCSGLGRTWGKSGQTNGLRTTGSSITTMRLRTRLWLCSLFGLQKHDGRPPPLYSPDSALRNFLFSQNEDKVEGAKIWHRRGYTGRKEGGVEDTNATGPPGHRPIVAETLGSMCTLLWRWRWWLGLWLCLLLTRYISVNFG